jgi:class 3 adenylate cyclase/tetratricopeptide (TPR) repeat protein
MSTMDDAKFTISNSPPTAIRGERRQVSVLFADVVGFTAIVERQGEEKALVIERMIYDTLTGAVRDHGGSVRAFAGDSVMAVYGIPEAQEDAALRACRTAVAIHAAFAKAADDMEARFGERLVVRVGVASGVVVMASVEGDDGEPTAVGGTVNLASRLQSLAPPGGTLMCEATQRLVEWLVDASFDGERAIKGRSKPLRVWRLTAVRKHAARFDASLRRGLSRFVGRDSELAQLRAALARATAQRQIVEISAEPGLGKTRLVFEFLRRLEAGEVLVLTGYCTADGRQVPFLPFLDVVRDAFRIKQDDDTDEIAEKLDSGLTALGLRSAENLGLLLNLLGLEPPGGALSGLDGVLIGLRTRDLLPALLAARCRSSAIILLLEDVQWIDGASEELLGRIIETGAQQNILIVHTSRPEYVPRWRGAPGVTRLVLTPLAASEIRFIVQTRLGVDSAPDALIREVTDRAAGNPLFGEEILGFLIDEGALRVASGRADFDAAPGESGLPASLQSLLAARMERLPRQDRALLQAAAAIGRRFDPHLLSLVVEQPDEVGAALQRLESQDIVHRDAKSWDYEFKHILLRDSVYQSLLTGQRAILHRRIAEALEARSSGRLAEVAEALAHHYGFTDRKDLVFTYLAMAGAKGLGVFSLDEADQYFASALALYESDPACSDDDSFAECLANCALCLNLSLRVKRIAELAARFGPVLNRIGDNRHHVFFLHHQVSSLIWSGRYLEALRVQQNLCAMARRLGDQKSLAYALVSGLSVSIYAAPIPREAFKARSRAAEAALANVEDAYLRYFYLANVGWDEVCRGRVIEARAAADLLTQIGRSTNEPRSLGYGTAMKALIALLTDDYELAIEEAERTIDVSRAPFEKAIAVSTKYAALALLNGPGAVEEVKRYVAMCEANGWLLFQQTPETMIGISLAMAGRIDEALRHIEAAIARREREGFRAPADWYRLFVCEIYLAILSGEGGGSLGALVRNIRSVAAVKLFGPRRIRSLIGKVRGNPQFDPEGYFFARTELILGLLYKARKNNKLAERHLTEARRILGAFGPTPSLTRVETALAALAGHSSYAPSAAR